MIKINDKEYKIKDWDTLTIDQAQQLTDIELPVKMKKLYMAKDEKEYNKALGEMTVSDEIEFGVYAGEVLRIMSDIPGELIDYMQYYDRNDLYEYYCREKIVSLLSDMPLYEPKEMKSFEFEGETYHFPEGLKILDKYLPNHSEKSLTFIEGQAIFKAYVESKDKGDISMLIAVYCRPEGEEYDEKKTIERAERFGSLPMEVALEVFFYIFEQLNTSTRIISTYCQQILRRDFVKAN